MNTLDQKERRDFFALFKGPSGAGKSVAAMSFPTPYIFDYDMKMPAIALKHFKNKSIEYDTFPDVFKASDKLAEFVKDGCPYETLIHDSVTNLSSLTLSSIAQAKGETVPQLIQSIKRTQAGKSMVELMGIDYYNAETRFMEYVLDISKILWCKPGNPKHIIFTAHILTVDSAPDLKTRLVTRTRSIVTAGRKVAAVFPTKFDEVYTFGTREEGGLQGEGSTIKHIMTTQTEGEDDSKTAFNLARYTDFTNGNLYEKLMQQISGAELFS